MHATSAIITPAPSPRLPRESSLPVRMEFRDGSQRAAVMELWQTLERKLSNQRITCSALWTNTWLTHFASRVPHQFALGRRGAELIGVCLITKSVQPLYGPLAIRTLHVGTAGESDADSVCIEHNTMLVSPVDHPEFLRELHQSLMQQPDCDAVAWDGFDPTDFPPEMTCAADWQMVVKPTFYFDLRRVRELGVEPISLLGDSTRKGIRQNLRDLGDVQVDWSETADQADEIFAELVQLHQARWQSTGKPGAFASSTFCAFHLDVVQQLLPQQRAALVRVRAGQQSIGCTLLYFDQNRALVYQGGWSFTAAVCKSPGLINDFCCLSECLRRGFDAYDFMAGDSTHKRRLTTHQGKLAWATARRTAWKFQTLDRLRSAKQLWRSLLQRSGSARTALPQSGTAAVPSLTSEATP